jgi:hypothetical protein
VRGIPALWLDTGTPAPPPEKLAEKMKKGKKKKMKRKRRRRRAVKRLWPVWPVPPLALAGVQQ